MVRAGLYPSESKGGEVGLIAEIISVGTELLMGQIVNTDAQFVASRIAPLGYRVLYQVTVGDNRERLTQAVHTAIERADVVILTGGLGPTDDDLTKETVAAALGLTLVPMPAEVERLTAFFAARGRTMAPNNLKQAWFPEDATILPNPNGTAPGCVMTAGDKAAILLPGPPRELEPMFSDYALPWLAARSGSQLFSRELRIFGMGESDATYRLRDIIESQTNPTVAPYAKTCEVTLHVTALCESEAEGEKLLAPMVERICERLGDVVYSLDGRSLPQTCAALLTARGATLAVAESCTGGMIASSLVDVPGCSSFFVEGCVTYTDAAKARRLGVAEETLRTHGAVSEQCAREMAEGMRRTAGADYALATTGYAGPDGGTDDAPVGTVFVALAAPDGIRTERLSLHGGRARIRQYSALFALDMLRRKLCTPDARA